MAYLEPAQHERLKKFSEATEIAMSQLVREGIESRISSGDRFVAGYNKAIEDCVKAVNGNRVSQMSFPSGKTFGEVFTEDINQLVIKDGTEGKISAEELVARVHEGEAESADKSDTDLGI